MACWFVISNGVQNVADNINSHDPNIVIPHHIINANIQQNNNTTSTNLAAAAAASTPVAEDQHQP